MKILLININPVVSRLMALCTRDKSIVIDEVVNANMAEYNTYDIVFVDDASYADDVRKLLATLSVRKKVFLSSENQEVPGFDEIVKKPFLPSQIIAMIENIDMTAKEESSSSFIFPLSTEESIIAEEEIVESVNKTTSRVLDSNEIEKIKALLDMQDNENEETFLSDEEYEARKMGAIKQQLINEGVEIVDEEEIIDKLSGTRWDDFLGIERVESMEDISLGNKNKENKRPTMIDEERNTLQVLFSTAVKNMKKKKIQKLLKKIENNEKICLRVKNNA